MIPLLPHISGGPAVALVSVEPLPTAEGFSEIMDQTTASPSEGGGLLAMLSMLPLMPLPQPAADSGTAAPLPGPVSTPPMSVLPALVSARSEPDLPLTAAVPSDISTAAAPLAVAPEAPLPMTKPTETLSPPAPDLQPAAAAQGPVPRQAPDAPAPSTLPPASLKEVAFLSVIEPQVKVSPAAIPPDPLAVRAGLVIPPAAPILIGPRAPAPATVEPDTERQDMPKVTQAALPHSLAPQPEQKSMALAPAGAMLDPDPQPLADPQMSPVVTLDRSGPPSGLGMVAMPSSVTASLLAQAPQAALGPVELVLNPEELGKVRFEIHQNGDQIKVILTVERPETLDLLRRHADQLVQEFRAAGYSGASLNFGHWGAQQGGTARQTAKTETDFATPEAPLSSQPPRYNPVPSQGLNLRL